MMKICKIGYRARGRKKCSKVHAIEGKHAYYWRGLRCEVCDPSRLAVNLIGRLVPSSSSRLRGSRSSGLGLKLLKLSGNGGGTGGAVALAIRLGLGKGASTGKREAEPTNSSNPFPSSWAGHSKWTQWKTLQMQQKKKHVRFPNG